MAFPAKSAVRVQYTVCGLEMLTDDRERGGRGGLAPVLLSQCSEVLGEESEKESDAVRRVTFGMFWGLLDLSFHTVQLFTSNSITALIY